MAGRSSLVRCRPQHKSFDDPGGGAKRPQSPVSGTPQSPPRATNRLGGTEKKKGLFNRIPNLLGASRSSKHTINAPRDLTHPVRVDPNLPTGDHPRLSAEWQQVPSEETSPMACTNPTRIWAPVDLEADSADLMYNVEGPGPPAMSSPSSPESKKPGSTSTPGDWALTVRPATYLATPYSHDTATISVPVATSKTVEPLWSWASALKIGGVVVVWTLVLWIVGVL